MDLTEAADSPSPAQRDARPSAAQEVAPAVEDARDGQRLPPAPGTLLRTEEPSVDHSDIQVFLCPVRMREHE